ncbi:MAG: phosphate propanoyltransferase [Eubacteriales bacterium]|nr:phosphate propanoyltransferase [Eubacteriales bacterium]
MKFIVETSARHVHVTKEDLEILFGKGYKLTKKKDLSQPNQFAAEEKVTVVGEKGELKMSILGPEREKTQVEVSMTDARTLGVNPPIKESGDLDEAFPCKIIGPKGEVECKNAIIVAKRHIHATPEDAEKLGIKNGDIVNVKVESKDRSIIFGNTVCRVSPSYALAMHIDTDEANAVCYGKQGEGEIVK